jgi:hypothetical protein
VGRTALAEGIAALDVKPVLHGDNGATLKATTVLAMHRHSATRYVTPAQRHAGEDQALLAARHTLYTEARQLNPARWSGNTCDWSYIDAVTLNPERDSVVKAHLSPSDTLPLAA